MTTDDANFLLGIAKANYPNTFKHFSTQDMANLVKSWTLALHDIDGDIVALAFTRLLSTSKWFPSVAEIRNTVGDLRKEAEALLISLRCEEDLYNDESFQWESPDEKARAIYNLQVKLNYATSLITRTEHLAQGLNGNGNGISLPAMLSFASRDINPSLMTPLDTLPD